MTEKLNSKQRTIAILAIVLIGMVGFGLAASNIFLLTEGTHLAADDGPEIELQENVDFTDITHPFPDENTIQFRPDASLSSDGYSFARVSGLDDEFVRLEDVDAANALTVSIDDKDALTIEGSPDTVEWRGLNIDSGETDLRISSSSQTTVTIDQSSSDVVLAIVDGEPVDFDTGSTLTFDIPDGEHYVSFMLDPLALSDPDPVSGAEVSERAVELSIDVVTDGETTVSFYDAEDESLIGEDTLTNDGRASVSWDEVRAGSNQWFAVAESEFGTTVTSDTFDLFTPAYLEIRDEVTGELVSGEMELELQFIDDAGGGEEVFTRTTTDGNISLEGLPTDRRLVVRMEAEGYLTRTAVIDSIVEQDTAYLLNETEDTVLKTFILDDRTSAFPTEETVLKISKPIDDGETTSFRVMAGDYFEGGGELALLLRQDDRYRMTVENEDGDSRSLGSFTAESDSTRTLDIGTIEFNAPEDRGFVFSASTFETGEGENATMNARVRYYDGAEVTDKITWRIKYLGNETVVHGDVTVQEPRAYQESVELPNPDANYEIVYEINRGGETIENRQALGGVSSLNWPIPADWLSAFGLVGIVAFAGLFGGTMSRTGAVLIVVAAIGMTTLGVLSISPVWLSLAGVAALLFKFADAGGVQ